MPYATIVKHQFTKADQFTDTETDTDVGRFRTHGFSEDFKMRRYLEDDRGRISPYLDLVISFKA